MRERMIERLVYAVIMALLALWGRGATGIAIDENNQKIVVEEKRSAELESYRQFIIEMMERGCLSEEEE